MPKQAALRLRPTSKPGYTHTILIPTRYRAVAGKREAFFVSERKGKEFIKDLLDKIGKQGEAASELDPIQIADLSYALEQLKPWGKKLGEAADFFVAHLKRNTTSITCEELSKRYITAVTAASVHLADKGYHNIAKIKRVTKVFNRAFGSWMISSITVETVRDWLRVQGSREKEINGVPVPAEWIPPQPLKARTIAGFRTTMLSVFNHAKPQFIKENVWIDTTAIRDEGRVIHIFRQPSIFAKLLAENTNPELHLFFVIGAFAGLRPECEIPKLMWEHIDFDNFDGAGSIWVEGDGTNSYSRRFVKMQPNLRKYLLAVRKLSGPVLTRRKYRVDADRRALLTRLGIKWEQDIMRHSFATYHLATFNDIPALMRDMGHSSPKMIEKHYRVPLPPDAAKRWWAIEPEAQAENIVDFKREAKTA